MNNLKHLDFELEFGLPPRSGSSFTTRVKSSPSLRGRSNPTQTLSVFVFMVALLFVCSNVHAQSLEPDVAQAADKPAPTLEFEADPEVPYYTIALSADLYHILMGVYGVRFEYAFARAHAFWLSPSLGQFGKFGTLGITLGYHLWPLGKGLEGLYFGPTFTVASIPMQSQQDRQFGITAGAEAGWQFVFSGLVASLGVSASYEIPTGQPHRSHAFVPEVRLALGYSWL